MAISLRGSLVQSTYDPRGPVPSRCGYCRSEDTFFVEAIWSYKMTCGDYQDLVDRGFQRSGKCVYRPVMKETCCPQYVIQTDVVKFRPSKSQKSTVRKFNRFLLNGRPAQTPSNSELPPSVMEQTPTTPSLGSGSELVCEVTTASHLHLGAMSRQEANMSEGDHDPPSTSIKTRKTKEVHRGKGADPLKPPARKAKLIRRERRLKKKADVDAAIIPPAKKNLSPGPSLHESRPSSELPLSVDFPLEKLISLPDPNDCKHKFETRLIPVDPFSPLYALTRQESFELFVKFQRIIHKEKPEDCTINNFRDFIESTPLVSTDGTEGMPCGYGTYHQQYFIDGQLVAVGVLDILPRGVLCEYLYYDPDYRFLAPGVYTAINEISLTQQFYRVNPCMQYYYMGFYVQSCPKMNYKSRYSASCLLCPETHLYVPMRDCIPKLIASGYARLAKEEAPNVKEKYSEDERDLVPLFCLSSLDDPSVDTRNVTYQVLRSRQGDAFQPWIEDYLRIVGLEVALRMTLCFTNEF